MEPKLINKTPQIIVHKQTFFIIYATQNSNQSMDVNVDDDDNKNDTEQSILWRFYAQKRG